MKIVALNLTNLLIAFSIAKAICKYSLPHGGEVAFSTASNNLSTELFRGVRKIISVKAVPLLWKKENHNKMYFVGLAARQ